MYEIVTIDFSININGSFVELNIMFVETLWKRKTACSAAFLRV